MPVRVHRNARAGTAGRRGSGLDGPETIERVQRRLGRNHHRVGTGRDVRRTDRGALFGRAPQSGAQHRAGRRGFVSVGVGAGIRRGAAAGRILRRSAGIHIL